MKFAIFVAYIASFASAAVPQDEDGFTDYLAQQIAEGKTDDEILAMAQEFVDQQNEGDEFGELDCEADLDLDDAASREKEILEAAKLPKCTSDRGCGGGANISNCFGCPSCEKKLAQEMADEVEDFLAELEAEQANAKEQEILDAAKQPKCFSMNNCGGAKPTLDNCFGCPSCDKKE